MTPDKVTRDREIWEIITEANKVGRPLTFETPEIMWEKACGYFTWAKANPLEEEKLFNSSGEILRETVYLARPFSIKAFCLHARITHQTWLNYKNNPEFLGVTEQISSISFTQQFDGASVGLFNSNLIARSLGLADKTESKVEVKSHEEALKELGDD